MLIMFISHLAGQFNIPVNSINQLAKVEQLRPWYENLDRFPNLRHYDANQPHRFRVFCNAYLYPYVKRYREQYVTFVHPTQKNATENVFL